MILKVRPETPNDPKLRCGGPGGAVSEHGGARRRRGLCMACGKAVVEAQPVTEPGGRTAGDRRLTAMPAVTCSAWLGVRVGLAKATGVLAWKDERMAERLVDGNVLTEERQWQSRRERWSGSADSLKAEAQPECREAKRDKSSLGVESEASDLAKSSVRK